MSSYSGLTGAFSRSAPPPRSQALEAPTAPPRSFEVPAAPPGSFDVPTVPPTHHRSSRNEDPQTQTIPLIPSNRDDLPYGSLLGLAKYGRPEMVYNHADRVFEGTSLMRTVPSDDDRPTIVLEIAWPGYQKRRFREEIPLTDLPRSKPITRGELAIAVAHAYLNFMEKAKKRIYDANAAGGNYWSIRDNYRVFHPDNMVICSLERYSGNLYHAVVRVFPPT